MHRHLAPPRLLLDRLPLVLTGALLASSLALAAPALAQTAMAPPADAPALPWAVTVRPTPIQSGPDESSVRFGLLRSLSPLQILGYAGEWAYVYNPRARGTGYVRSDTLGPSDAPSKYLFADPPPVVEELVATGWLTRDLPLAVYPTAADEAVAARLGPGSTVSIAATVRGDDGALWYRTVDGDYLPTAAVFVPSAPALFGGRWMDVDLSEPAQLTAYEGDQAVRSMLVIKGKAPGTPTGVFRVLRRVADETMDSSTIGIPRDGPGGYYLKNVLYTQYFLPTGESLHYNYWSSNFGYAGSHGCLGLSLADSEFLWGWADLGTPVSIHS